MTRDGVTNKPNDTGLTPMTRVGVTNKCNDDELAQMTRGGITTGTADPRTSVPDRPPAKAQSSSHQHTILTVTIYPFDQAKQVTVKGTL